MKKIYLVIIIISIFSKLYSQSLIDIISDMDKNYFEKLEIINNNKALTTDSNNLWQIKRYDRWKSFWDSRIDQNGEYTTYLNTMSNIEIPKSTTENIWQSIGHKNDILPIDFKFIGRVQSIWVRPDNFNIIFIGASNGGLWKTADGGVNWQSVTPQYSFGVTKIISHPSNYDTMFIVTGNYGQGLLSHGYYGQGIFNSTDGGESWNPVVGFTPSNMIYMSDIIYDPVNYDTMYAVCTKRIFKSIDGGVNWTVLSARPTAETSTFSEIRINPVATNYIVVSGSNEFQTSSDGGTTWTSIDFFSTETNDSYIKVDYSPTGKLFALYYYNTTGYYFKNYVKYSTNNGLTWAETNFFGEENSNGHATMSACFIKAQSDDIIWFGGVTIQKTTNSFLSHDPFSSSKVHDDIRDICFPYPTNLNLVYVVTDGGVNKNIYNDKNTWENINGNPPTSPSKLFQVFDLEAKYIKPPGLTR